VGPLPILNLKVGAHKDRRRFKVVLNLQTGLESVHHWHIQVHYYYVKTPSYSLVVGVQPICSLVDVLGNEVKDLALEHVLQDHQGDCFVINKENLHIVFILWARLHLELILGHQFQDHIYIYLGLTLDQLSFRPGAAIPAAHVLVKTIAGMTQLRLLFISLLGSYDLLVYDAVLPILNLLLIGGLVTMEPFESFVHLFLLLCSDWIN